VNFPAFSRVCSVILLTGLVAGARADAAETSKNWIAGLFSRELRELEARHEQLIAELATLPSALAALERAGGPPVEIAPAIRALPPESRTRAAASAAVALPAATAAAPGGPATTEGTTREQ